MITVIAGVNGAGKSSIFGSAIRQAGGDYCNPDEIARHLMQHDPDLDEATAAGQAWSIGFAQLNRAIAEDADYTFETTLGGLSIHRTLRGAIRRGRQVRILYCGLASVEQHLERIAARAARGGHDIPADKVRQRWDSSRFNAIGLCKGCHEMRLIDNSAPITGAIPAPRVLLHFRGPHWVTVPVADMPDWAKPIASAALRRIGAGD